MPPSKVHAGRGLTELEQPGVAQGQPEMPDDHILISVAVPVFDGGQAFRRCLEALAATRYDRYEVIVVDDGSTDGSDQLASGFGCRVLYTQQPRCGPGAARNLGAQAARGDVLFFLDADVVVKPDTIGQIAEAFQKDPALDGLFGSYDDAPAAPNFLSQYKNLFHHFVHQNSSEQAATFWSGCGAMRRHVFLRHRGFDAERYRRPCIEDIELGYRVTQDGGYIRLVKDLQVKHLKRWTVLSLLRSDILDRGIPWSRLLLREHAFANDLNLQTANRLSVVMAYVLVLALIAWLRVPWGWLVALGAAVVLLGLNWPLYRWFARKRGLVFALAVIPWHWLYYLYNGLSFGVGLALHLGDYHGPALAGLARWGLIGLVLLAAWLLRLLRLDFQDIWWDEARNIDVATRPFLQVASSPELDIHPPLYYYLLHLWARVAGVSAFALRFLSVWFGVLTVALAYRLGRGLARGRRGLSVGLLALIVAGVAPFGLAEAQETRMYTVSWALLAAAMLALWGATRGEQPTDLKGLILGWAPFTVLAAAALLTHYATAIILMTWALWLAIWALRSPDRGRRLLTLVGVGMAVVALLLPAAPIGLRQIPGYDNPNLSLPTLPSYLSQLYRSFTLGDAVPQDAWTLGRWLWLGLVLGGAVLALVTWHRSMARVEQDRLGLLALWLLGGLAVYYAILVRRSAFNPRYISFVLPALWALTGWALVGWRSLARPLPWLATAALVVVSLVSLRADLTDPRFFREDARGVVRWLQERAGPEDIILVDQRYPFGFYWPRWNNAHEGLPPSEPSDQAPAQYLFVDINTIDGRLSELAGRASRLFWVKWFESDTDPRGAVDALLGAYGRQEDEADFRGYTVEQWRFEPPTEFRLAQDYYPLNLPFESGVTLLAGDWQGRVEPIGGSHPVLVSLRWQADGPTAMPLKASLRLKNSSGKTVAQEDRLLLNDRHLRTTAWQSGDPVLNVHSLDTSALADGTYSLTLVLYDEDSLAPVGLADGSGTEPVLGQVRMGR